MNRANRLPAFKVTDTTYHTIANFKFVDQDSALITNETFKDKIYVADFFFTSCRTICPIMKHRCTAFMIEQDGNRLICRFEMPSKGIQESIRLIIYSLIYNVLNSLI